MMNRGVRRENIFVNDIDLHSRLKNDPGKPLMAARVRTETTLPIEWIASRLQMGASKSLKRMLLAWMHTLKKLTQTRHVRKFNSNLRPLSD